MERVTKRVKETKETIGDIKTKLNSLEGQISAILNEIDDSGPPINEAVKLLEYLKKTETEIRHRLDEFTAKKGGGSK